MPRPIGQKNRLLEPLGRFASLANFFCRHYAYISTAVKSLVLYNRCGEKGRGICIYFGKPGTSPAT